jgi:ABC-type bacteriocin/lantibiotic exporter with double-glycine peptidase domain
MQTAHIHTLLATLAELTGHAFDHFDLKERLREADYTDRNSVYRFLDDLTAKAAEIQLGIVNNGLPPEELMGFLEQITYPVVVFRACENGAFEPVVIYRHKKELKALRILEDHTDNQAITPGFMQNLFTYQHEADTSLNGRILFAACFTIDNLVEEPGTQKADKPPTPFQRFMRLLGNEKKEITYIYIYSILVGLIGLIVPLGVQRVIGFVSSGQTFSSVYLLIGLVIVGTALSGILQVVQVSLVETLQQRIFAQAAFEFAYRLPRIRSEALLKSYPPELMNRFFDILTIQKSLPKFLIDLTAALLQIVLGLILLGFYNSSFILFGLFLFALLILVFFITAPKGLKTSLVESKYKYKVAHWLEEIARTLYSFKLSGNSNLPMQKMDNYVSHYLYYRQKHFKVLQLLFINSVAFKVLVTGAMLVLGTFLVIDRQITLGQFVASEIVIILVIGAVEKLIMSMDVVYDLLTSVEKLGQVTDLPLEKDTGLKTFARQSEGLELNVANLSYKYPGAEHNSLRSIDFHVAPGEHICLAGPTDAGKNTLTRILSGILESYQGSITVNGSSLKSLNLKYLRDAIKKNIAVDDVFNGTLLDNLTMGKSSIRYEDVLWAMDKVDLTSIVNGLPEGLNTEIIAGGKEFSESDLYRIGLARCIIAKPKLLIINDFFQHFNQKEKLRILQFLQDRTYNWSMIIISNDPAVMATCDKVVVLNNGMVAVQGSYQVLLANPAFQDLVLENLEPELKGNGQLTTPRLSDKRFQG